MVFEMSYNLFYSSHYYKAQVVILLKKNIIYCSNTVGPALFQSHLSQAHFQNIPTRYYSYFMK